MVASWLSGLWRLYSQTPWVQVPQLPFFSFFSFLSQPAGFQLTFVFMYVFLYYIYTSKNCISVKVDMFSCVVKVVCLLCI